MPHYEDHERSFLDAINSLDAFTQAVKGHRFLDEVVTELIAEVLPVDHSVEIARIGFVLKVDLAIALGAFPDDLRPLAERINRTRNGFAHSTTTSLDRDAALELFNMMPRTLKSEIEDDRENPQRMLRESLFILYVVVTASVERVRDGKVRSAELLGMVEEAMARQPGHSEHVLEKQREREALIDLRVAEEKAKRNAEGKR